MKICPKCGSIAEYDSYYGRNICTRCSFEWLEISGTDDNKGVVAQLFTREISENIFGPGVYLVCGIMKTDKPLNTETVNVMSGKLLHVKSKDVSNFSIGSGLDSIMSQPIWRKFK